MDHGRWKTAGFNPATVKRITTLTDRNAHTEALILGAEMLGASGVVKKLKLVLQLHNLEGHLPTPLGEYRRILYEEVMRLAKQSLDREQFQSFYGAF